MIYHISHKDLNIYDKMKDFQEKMNKSRIILDTILIDTNDKELDTILKETIKKYNTQVRSAFSILRDSIFTILNETIENYNAQVSS